jgi:hypothetical protein
MKTRSRWKWGALVAIAAAACGGTTLTSLDTDGGATDAGSGPDSGDAGAAADAPVTTDAAGDVQTVSPFCPAAPPAVGAPCTRANLTCEYGGSNDPLCNTTYACDGQQWSKGFDGSHCGFTGTNDPACPATYAGVPRGGACGAVSLCEYPEGRCECTLGCGGPPPPPDAGNHWICTVASAGCPSPRGGNVLGAACATPGLSCTYGACCAGANQTCTDAGIWEGNILAGGCP